MSGRCQCRCQWPISLAVPILALAATLLLLVFNLSTALKGYGAGVFFAYHPVLMCLGFLLFFPLGIVSYSFDFGASGNSFCPTRESRRFLHGVLMFLGAACVLAGYLLAFVHHEAVGSDHLALTRQTPTRPAHVILGILAISGVVAQIISGLYKAIVATRDGEVKVLAVHGLVIGPLVWLAGLTCIALAAWFEYRENFGVDAPPSAAGKHWSVEQMVGIWIALLLLALAVFIARWRGARAPAAAADDYEAVGGSMGHDGAAGSFYNDQDYSPSNPRAGNYAGGLLGLQ